MQALRTWSRSVAAEAGPWIRQVMAAGLGLMALALVTGSLGNLSTTLNGTLAVGAMLGLALLLQVRSGEREWWRWVVAVGGGVAGLIAVARGAPWGLLGAGIFFFALLLVTADDLAGTLDTLLLTALFFGLYWIGVAYVPMLWHAERAAAEAFSRTVGVGLVLGPTALGLPLFWLFASYALSTLLLALGGSGSTATLRPSEQRSAKKRAAWLFVVWIGALVLAEAAYLWLQPPLGSWLLTHWPAPATPTSNATAVPTLTYLESLPLLFFLLGLVSAAFGFWLRPQPLPLSPRPGTVRWAVAGLALLALAAAALTLDPPQHPQRGTVLFHDTGHLEWGRPTFGQYGPQSGGTFGLWPDYLAAYGYQAQIGLLTDENLARAQAVVLINLPQALSAAEKERLLHFVAEGGGLVIWGEHTGLDRIREPTNELLAGLPGAPIQLRFDSAVPTRQGWADSLALRPLPALYGVQDAADLVIAVGASLDVRPPAQALIVGRFGHSDAGDSSNLARNYVGDMRYNFGERLGDLVLAAAVQHGRGRIVVLGDTTPAGSVNLMTSMPFQVRMLDWVTAGAPQGVARLLHNGWLAALLLAGAVVCLAAGRSRAVLAGAALVLGLTVAAATWANQVRSAPPIPEGPIAAVDISHQERFDRLLWEETSIGGLDYNLVRNGLVPLLHREIKADTLAKASLLVLVAPAQPFSAQEVAAIRRWVEGGGRLLASVGFEERLGSEALLAAFGLGVDSIPLGPAEVAGEPVPVRFHEAWPVQASGEDTKTIVSAYGYPLAVYQPWGKGGVALIGDSAFLLGSNLEGQQGYQEGNILLLQEMLNRYLKVGGAQ